MIKIKLASIGKSKEKWLEEGVEEYIKRMKSIATVECYWLKDNEQLTHFARKEALFICLDVSGLPLDSVEFSSYLHTKLIEGGSRLAFIIGGAEGLPQSLQQHPHRISLSKMTMTHQLARLVLLEQIYRAFEIAKGSPYHK
jgi:23S rRNA (pseudouridine1915-N3)-methyltransferase